jgi:hypothetical protein
LSEVADLSDEEGEGEEGEDEARLIASWTKVGRVSAAAFKWRGNGRARAQWIVTCCVPLLRRLLQGAMAGGAPGGQPAPTAKPPRSVSWGVGVAEDATPEELAADLYARFHARGKVREDANARREYKEKQRDPVLSHLHAFAFISIAVPSPP